MRKTERLLLFISTAVLVLMAWCYLDNVNPLFEETKLRYNPDSLSCINLDERVNAEQIRHLLHKQDYFGDPVYEAYAARKLQDLCRQLKLPNLGVLNKRNYEGVTVQVPALELAQEGGSTGLRRYIESCIMLGRDSLTMRQIKSLGELSHTLAVDSIGTLSLWGRILDTDKQPVVGCVVRLREEISGTELDKRYKAYLERYKGNSKTYLDLNPDSVLRQPSYYVQTDKDGYYRFTQLTEGNSYSVLPLREGKSYGAPKGVAQISPKTKAKALELNFSEREHRLPIFEGASLSQMRKDRSFTVRTPETYRQAFIQGVALFLLSFWLLHIGLCLYDSMMRKRLGNTGRVNNTGLAPADEWILPLVGFLSGIGYLMLYTLQDPLMDMLYGPRATWLILALCIATVLAFFLSPVLRPILHWDLERYNHTSSPLRFLGKLSSWIPGWPWLLLSIAMMAGLAVFGTGPDGSNVKVNLGFFQPSELSKFCFLLFMACFLSSNKYALGQVTDSRKIFWRYLAASLGLILILIGIYVGVVGDQGPALVLCITYALMYAYSRGELGKSLALSLGFVALLLGVSWLGLGIGALALVALAVCLALFVYVVWINRQSKLEGLLLPLGIITAFIVLPAIPQLLGIEADFIQRLNDRNSMYADIWNNHLYGGDQVAHGVWSLNSGGLLGQGLGEGLSRTMPAHNTDMIFESVGEELGILFLILLLGLYMLLFMRTLLIARNTGNKLYAYLILSLSVATMVQLGVILCGSLGLMPLTGISVPLLSRGDTSLIVNLALFWVILFLSQFVGRHEEVQHYLKSYGLQNRNLFLGVSALLLLLVGKLGLVWWQAEATMVREVQTLSRQGAYILSENPRLKALRAKLPRGNIYDRNGVLLATSSKESFLAVEKEAERHGANMQEFKQQKYRMRGRYYPYGMDLVYWLGDAEHMLVTSTQLGLVAEYRYQDELRGLQTPIITDESVESEYYRELPYLPRDTTAHKTRLTRRDYSAYIPYLKAGTDSEKVRNYSTERKSDITLSLDMSLQKILTDLVRQEKYKKYRVSAVAMLSKTGDVLASAMNPRPDREAIKRMASFPREYYQMLYTNAFGYDPTVADSDYGIARRSTPGSVIKTIDAMAFLNKVGIGARDTVYIFTEAEKIQKDDPVDRVRLAKALIESSNNYFITLMNKEELHHQLFPLYSSVGINIALPKTRGDRGGYFVDRPMTEDTKSIHALWYDFISINKGWHFNNPKLQGTKLKYMGSDYSFIAWGQGPVEATPLHMARLYGAIANDGVLQENRFLLRDRTGERPIASYGAVMTKPETVGFLEATLAQQKATTGIVKRLKERHLELPGGLHGKTGTPERKRQYLYRGKVAHAKVNDAWYVCYTKKSRYDSPLVLCIRIEGMGGSALAAALAEEALAKLKEQGYLGAKSSQEE